MWHIVLGIKIEDKFAFYLHYFGIISANIYSISTAFWLLNLFTEYYVVWYYLNTIFWAAIYNLYIVMFFIQSSMWFGQIYRRISIVAIVTIQIFMVLITYYYFLMLYSPTDETQRITDIFDCGMTTGLSIIEFVFNMVTLYKIVKEAYKSRSPIAFKLLIKLVTVAVIFTVADIALTVIYIVKNKYYSLIFIGFLLALKIQTEYFCLNRIRQCILIPHSIHNT
jgi:hypothetical protein